MTPLLLIGGGGHCRSCIDVIEQAGGYRIAGIVDGNLKLEEQVLGYEVLGDDCDLPWLIEKFKNAFVAVGQIHSVTPRKKLFDKLKNLEAALPTIVSPRAYISKHATVAAGTVAMHGVVVNAGAKIGANVILNSQSLVEHDVRVGNHCHISTGVKINGGVTMKEGTFVGSGAIIHEGLKLGSNCIIGAGCIIKSDLSDNTVLLNNN